jgi:hypothetical protein
LPNTRKLVMFTNALMLSGSVPSRLLFGKILCGARAVAGQQNGQWCREGTGLTEEREGGAAAARETHIPLMAVPPLLQATSRDALE